MKTFPFGEIADLRQGATLNRYLSEDELGEELEIIQVSNLSEDGILGPFDVGRFEVDRLKSLRAREGEVLLAQAANNLSASVVAADQQGHVVGQNIAIILIRATYATPEFVAAFLNMESTRRQLQRRAGGAGTQQVSLTELKRFPFPCPPLDYQVAFVRLFAASIATKRAADDLVAAQRDRIELAAAGLWNEVRGQR